MPPEAHQGSPLTTAANVYQVGGLCYFMATGTHPPAQLHQASLPDCAAKGWRQLVSCARLATLQTAPTVAQLQLYLLTICRRPVKQVPMAVRSPGKASPAVSAQRYSSRHRQGKPFPAMSHKAQALEVATPNSASALPHTASNPLFVLSSTPSQVTPAEYKASSAAPSQTTSLTAAAPRASRHTARAHRASPTAAQAPGAFISVPHLMLGVKQWLPEDSISCIEHRQGSPSSPHAAASSQQSNGGLDGETAAAGSSGAGMQLARRGTGKSGAARMCRIGTS